MIRSQDIEAVWRSEIWQSATVAAITPNCLQYDVSVQNEVDVAQLSYNGEINFFMAKTLRRAQPIIMNQTRYTFQVEVSYYLQQADIAQNTYQTVRDRLEEVDDLVLTALGVRWNDTVDFWEGGVPTNPREIEISEKICWTGTITYSAFKTL